MEPPAEVSRRLDKSNFAARVLLGPVSLALPEPAGSAVEDEQAEFNVEQVNMIIDMAGRELACKSGLPEHSFDDALCVLKESFEPEDKDRQRSSTLSTGFLEHAIERRARWPT